MSMWGIGGATHTPYGVAGSHRPKPITERRGEFVHDEEVRELAANMGLTVKRVQRDLTLYRKKGIVPKWA